MLPIHPDLLDEIVDDLLLIPIDEASGKEDDKSEIVPHGVEDTSIQRDKGLEMDRFEHLNRTGLGRA